MKNTKRFYPRFAQYDRVGIAEYLEKKAQEGWKLCKIRAFSWEFRRITPQKIHYAVSYFQNMSEWDLYTTSALRSYREFCAHSGWEFVASAGKMQIFCCAAENPVPIDTDPLLEVECIHEGERKRVIKDWLTRIGFAASWVLMLWVRISNDAVIALSDRWTAFIIPLLAIETVMESARLCEYYLWYWRARAIARAEGRYVSMKGFHIASNFFAVTLLVLFLFCLTEWFLEDWKTATFSMLLVVIGCAAVFAVLWWMRREYYSQKTAIMVGIVVLFIVFGGVGGILIGMFDGENYESEATALPGSSLSQFRNSPLLTIDDIYGEEIYDESPLTSFNESFLIGYYDMRAYDKEMRLSYDVVEVYFSPLYELCLDRYLNSESAIVNDNGEVEIERYYVIDEEPWGADTAYRYGVDDENCRHLWLLCYGNRIVEILLSVEPTPEQMALIGETLGGK